jgi:hypothetical protein
MATPDDQVDFDVLQRQRAMELLAELGLGRPNAVPRNSLCPCGSGMKFKSCCLRRIETGQARSGHVKPRVIFQG